MANKKATLKEGTGVDLAGRRNFSYRMLGDAGADNASDLGSWIKVDATQWKGFQIQPVDQVAGSIGGTTQVVIEGAFELDDESDNFSSVRDPHQIGTLDNITRHIAIETPFRWVRARVTAFSGNPVHVGLLALS